MAKEKNMWSSKSLLDLSTTSLVTRQTFQQASFPGGGVISVVCTHVLVCTRGKEGEERHLINHFLQILPFGASCKLISLLFSSFDLCIGLLGFVFHLMAIGLDLAGCTIKMLGDLHAVC